MPDARVVDEHVEAAEALVVARDDAAHGVLVRHVRRHLLDLVARAAQVPGGGGELLRAPGGDGQREALLAEHAGDGEPDAARGSGDERGTVRHGRGPLLGGGRRIQSLAPPTLSAVPNRTPVVVCVVLLLGLGAALVAGGGDGGGGGGEPAVREPPAAPVATIARRVEALRGLRFRRPPEPVTVTAAQARREGLADLDRTYPPARRRADEEVLKLLGLLEPEDDLRAVFGAVLSEQVAGYYDSRSGRLRVVGGTGGSAALDELTLAHELTHALEDQRFRLDLEDAGPSGDRALARLALVEGTATAVMFEYAARHLDPGQAIGGWPPPPSARAARRPCRRSRRRSSCSPTSAGARSWSASTRRPAGAGPWSTRPSASARRSRPSRCCTRRSTCAPSRRAASRCAPGQCSARAGDAPRPPPGANGRPASSSAAGPAPSARRPAGAATATSCGAPAAAAARRRARAPTRSSCAGAGTPRRTGASSRPRSAAGRPGAGARPGPGGTFALRGGAVAVRRAGDVVTLVFAPTVALARRLAR